MKYFYYSLVLLCTTILISCNSDEIGEISNWDNANLQIKIASPTNNSYFANNDIDVTGIVVSEEKLKSVEITIGDSDYVLVGNETTWNYTFTSDMTQDLDGQQTIKVKATTVSDLTALDQVDIIFNRDEPNEVTLSDCPQDVTHSTQINITVSGNDIIAYKYKIDDNDWVTQDINDTIFVTNLQHGQHVLYVRGKNKMGVWQSVSESTSISWFVDLAVHYVAVGAHSIFTSIDGANWERSYYDIRYNLKSVACDGQLWVVVGRNESVSPWTSTVLTSDNGLDWNVQSTNINYPLNSITFGKLFVTVGERGQIYTSQNGTDWSQKDTLADVTLHGVKFNRTTYTIVGEDDTYIYSTDGTHFNLKSFIEPTCIIYDVSNFFGRDYLARSGGRIIIGSQYMNYFEEINTPRTASFYSIDSDEDCGILCAVGAAGYALKTQGSATWEDHVWEAMNITDNTLYTTRFLNNYWYFGGHSCLYRSNDLIDFEKLSFCIPDEAGTIYDIEYTQDIIK